MIEVTKDVKTKSRTFDKFSVNDVTGGFKNRRIAEKTILLYYAASFTHMYGCSLRFDWTADALSTGYSRIFHLAWTQLTIVFNWC